MRGSMKLDAESLAVESFTTTIIPPVPAPEAPKPQLTCLDTNCGKYFCCA